MDKPRSPAEERFPNEKNTYCIQKRSCTLHIRYSCHNLRISGSSGHRLFFLHRFPRSRPSFFPDVRDERLPANRLFQKLAVFVLSKTENTRQLAGVLVFLCFFMSMLITNDVSLITFVPFTVLILTITGQEKLMVFVIVLQTIAANLGSMLTPIGNPQNLYLYSLSGMSFSEFLGIMLPYTLLSALLLLLFLFLKPGEKVYVQEIFAETGPMRRRP